MALIWTTQPIEDEAGRRWKFFFEEIPVYHYGAFLVFVLITDFFEYSDLRNHLFVLFKNHLKVCTEEEGSCGTIILTK